MLKDRAKYKISGWLLHNEGKNQPSFYICNHNTKLYNFASAAEPPYCRFGVLQGTYIEYGIAGTAPLFFIYRWATAC